jgi:hypothetical protein
MHIEVLVEDSSGKALLSHVLPKLLGPQMDPHTYNVHAYKGVGHIPKGLTSKGDVQKRILLDNLPRILSGYAKTPGIDAVVVIVDVDDRNCTAFLAELKALAAKAGRPDTLFRLAVEEIEAWYLGDRSAVLTAYPSAKKAILKRYKQDSICGTWETLAKAVLAGEAAPRPGDLKHEWAGTIGPHLDVTRNQSPSFQKLCEGLERLVSRESVAK